MYTLNDTMKKKTQDDVKGIEWKPLRIFGFKFEEKKDFNAPAEIDWRQRGAVTRVTNQKYCGSCFAMATVAALEGQYFLKTGKLVKLSQQEIIDCPQNYHSWGCAGGIAFRVFDYVKDNGGLSLAKDYPYEGKVGECRKNSANKVAIDVKGYSIVFSVNSTKILMQAVSEIGPLAVSMDIDHESLMRYSGGIYNNEKCLNTVNHGALLVGYKLADQESEGYWIIKNSFGESWGEKGYLRLAMNTESDCSIRSSPIYVTLN